MKKAITIKDIASALNLSRNTVAKALNGQYVPKNTREIVLKKAKEMNYKSLNSDDLKKVRHRILLFCGKPIHNMSFFVPIIQSIEGYCYDNGCDFFQYVYSKKTESFATISRYIKTLNVDGMIVIECFEKDMVNYLLSLKVPTCFIDFPGNKFEIKGKMDLICSSDQKLICEYVKELIRKFDYDRFTFVGDFRHCLSFHERYMGLLRGLTRSGKAHDAAEDILDDDSSFDYGNSSVLKDRISSFKYLPDCFICSNDFVARTVARAIKELGYSVPEDTMVVGFDDVDLAINEHPTLTTFDVDKTFLGKEAIRLLISRIQNKDCPSRTLMVDCKLVTRESTNNE